MSKKELESFRLKAFIIKICFFALMLALIIIFVFSVRIKSVTVEGNAVSAKENIISAANLRRGAHMYSIDKNALSKSILEKNPYVSSVTVRRRLPSTIIITVTEDKPSFFMAFGSDFLILSDRLRVLDVVQSPQGLSSSGIIPISLPTVTEAVPGKTLVCESARDYRLSAELIGQFASCDFADGITMIDISNRFAVKAVYKSKYTIVFGSYTDLEKKLKFCKKTIGYVEKNMPGVAGTIYATGTAETSFLVTGTAD